MGTQKFSKKKFFDDGSSLKKEDSKKISKKGKNMILQLRAEAFRCKHCRREVPLDSISTKHRNHCPYCLYSLHVDVSPGDRKSECHGSMKPIGICLKTDGGEIMIIHDCQKCGKLNINRISAEDSEQSIMNLLFESQNLNIDLLKKINKNKLIIVNDEKVIQTLLFGKRLRS